MTNLQHAFEPLDDVRTVPVRWELNQSDYDKLKISNDESENHWHCIMQDNTMHIYKGFNVGIEHFRFMVNPLGDGKYLIENIETHDIIEFYEQAKSKGWLDRETEQHQHQNDIDATDEVASILSRFFDIQVQF